MIPVGAKGGNRQPQSPDGFHIRAASFQPVRVACVRDGPLERLSIEPAGKRALVVGAGRGLLARELVRLALCRLAREVEEVKREEDAFFTQVLGDAEQAASPTTRTAR